MKDERPDKFDLGTAVRFLKGVGPHRAELFNRLGVDTVGDLLEYYPRGHEFRPPVVLMGELVRDHQVTVMGQIDQMRYNRRSRPPRLDVTLTDPSGACQLVWFHGGYLQDKLIPGDRVIAWGKVTQYKNTMQLINPHWQIFQEVEDVFDREESGMAIYPASGDLTSQEIGRVTRQSLDRLLGLVLEYYDQEFCAKRQFPSRAESLEWIHRPSNQEQIDQARRRLVYDELFAMELGIALRRERLQRRQSAWPMQIDKRLDERIRRRFPFKLTDDQDKVIVEICADIGQAKPMNRLLQGDVGSGKTVVALYAALLAVGHHKQAAIMAPTEILAEQHFDSIERFLRNSRVRRVLLKGGLTGKKRTEVIQRISEGEVDIVVGTQALLQSDIAFKQLAIVVVDEQHKFGVRQREIIRSKDVAPHYLVMTATPIPRTLAMTVFGDLDISVIEHLPPGRQPVDTRWIDPGKLPQAYEFIRGRVQDGQQAYFVYPRVEEADPNENDFGDQLKAATAEREYLQNKIFPEFNVGLLHGQMDRLEKKQTMEDFRQGKVNILVATIVIEVGVDVPNATIMVIEHAERFGLAQLHQLRGRIGRGDKQSYCLLFGAPKTEQAQQRLEIMTQTSDGFRIAEEDLRLRGPGEFFGTAQHGLPELKIADLLRDFDLLRMAQRDAFAMVKEDPELKEEKHQILRQVLWEKFGDDLGLVDVG